jgi:Rieske Fe-S protein
MWNATRRRVLRLLGLSAGGVIVAGCGDGQEAVPTLRIALGDLPDGQRVHAYLGDEPIELLRDGTDVRAMSLWCAHMGCRVKWEADRERYACPCHEGIFDSAGGVIAGPPLERLRPIALRVEDDVVIIGGE